MLAQTRYLDVLWQAFDGSMVYWYNSTSFFDDLAWAASWMYRATQDPAYLTDAVQFFGKHRGDVRPKT